jgi:hypothetical protein
VIDKSSEEGDVAVPPSALGSVEGAAATRLADDAYAVAS